jgi:cytoskeletal protein CcmA (bactofilin family)
MFTRSSSTEPKAIEPGNGTSNGAQQQQARRPEPPPQSRSGPGDLSSFSVISNDLRIIGQDLKIITQGSLKVDGEVEGDVQGNEIIIGELGQVRGTVAAEKVTVHGRIAGVIRGRSVALQSSARVEGDIHHMSLAIERGAEFDGRCRRPADAAELQLDLGGRR